MKMKPGDRLQDPFYVGLIYNIEQIIFAADREAEAINCRLNDSHIQSALIRTRKLVSGGHPKISDSSDRDRLLQKLIMSLYEAPDRLVEQATKSDGTNVEQPIKSSDWIKALETALNSLKLRRTGEPGGRDYLEFLADFIPRAQDRR